MAMTIDLAHPHGHSLSILLTIFLISFTKWCESTATNIKGKEKWWKVKQKDRNNQMAKTI